MGKIHIKLKEIIVDKTIDQPETIRIETDFVDSEGEHKHFSKTLTGLAPVATIPIGEYVFQKTYPAPGSTPGTGGGSGSDGMPPTTGRVSATGSMSVTKLEFQTKLSFWGVVIILVGMAFGAFLSYLFNGPNLFSLVSAALAGFTIASFIARLFKIDINFRTPVMVYYSHPLPPGGPQKWFEDGKDHLNQVVTFTVPSGMPGMIAGTEVSYTFVFVQE